MTDYESYGTTHIPTSVGNHRYYPDYESELMSDNVALQVISSDWVVKF